MKPYLGLALVLLVAPRCRCDGLADSNQGATPSMPSDAVQRYFAESEDGHKAHIASLGNLLIQQFPGISDGWVGRSSLSQLLKKVCKLKVEREGDRTMAWKE